MELLSFEQFTNENFSSLSKAEKEAKKDSKNGYVVHINKYGSKYHLEDWYDEDKTVKSYENGELK